MWQKHRGTNSAKLFSVFLCFFFLPLAPLSLANIFYCSTLQIGCIILVILFWLVAYFFLNILWLVATFKACLSAVVCLPLIGSCYYSILQQQLTSDRQLFLLLIENCFKSQCDFLAVFEPCCWLAAVMTLNTNGSCFDANHWLTAVLTL